jgi:hypothetical protein
MNHRFSGTRRDEAEAKVLLAGKTLLSEAKAG